MQGIPSSWNMSRFLGSSSKARQIDSGRPELCHRGAFEPSHLGVVAAVAHHEQVPSQPVVGQPRQRLWPDSQWAPGEQHDAEPRVEQLEQPGHLLDQRVVATSVEEGVPIPAAEVEEMLARGGIRQHAV